MHFFNKSKVTLIFPALEAEHFITRNQVSSACVCLFEILFTSAVSVAASDALVFREDVFLAACTHGNVGNNNILRWLQGLSSGGYTCLPLCPNQTELEDRIFWHIL